MSKSSPSLRFQLSSLSFVFLIAAGIVGSCSKFQDNQQSAAGSISSQFLESALDPVSAIMDEQGLQAFPITGSGCTGRAVQEPCIHGSKSFTYTNCTYQTAGSLPSSSSSSLLMNGTVKLDYTEVDASRLCDVGQGITTVAGETVTRSSKMTYQAGSGGLLSVNSDPHTDLRGLNYSQGTTLTSQSQTGSYSLKINGVRRILTPSDGSGAYDVSIRSLADLQVNGGLNRGSRAVSGGIIEVSHRQAQYIATFTIGNLVWGSTACCHPTSGVIQVTYSGSGSGTVPGAQTITFTGCGTARVTSASSAANEGVSFQNCE